MSEPVAFKYRAFISYSHADQDRAKWLHRAVESFPIGTDLAERFTERGEIPSALRPVFRDHEEFTAGGGLSEQTLAALDASRALIVIIVDGKPGDAERECFPPALRFKVDADGSVTDTPVELLAADARETADGKDLALAKIVAGLLGLPSDEVFRDRQLHRRARCGLGPRQATRHQREMGRRRAICSLALAHHRQAVPAAL
ncbi:MAG: hypothetical protein ABWY38_08795 [Methyloceanibacter sp.]